MVPASAATDCFAKGSKGYWRYWLLLPVLLFLTGAAAALGASVLRTLPQGSAEALASGIFLRESL
jgi:hypothetical protein